MRAHIRPLTLSIVRFLLCGLVLVGFGAAGWVAGQQPADKSKPKTEPPKGKKRHVEEKEDDAPPPTSSKVFRPEENPPAGTPSAPVTEEPTDLKAAAKFFRHPAARKLFEKLVPPEYDLVTLRALGGVGLREEEVPVKPLEEFVGGDGSPVKGKLEPVAREGKPARSDAPSSGRVKEVRHYEQLVLDNVHEFLKKEYEKEQGDNYLSRTDQLRAAELALAAGVRFCDEARKAKRKQPSKGWERLEADLREELKDRRIERLNLLVAGKKWEEAVALTGTLAQSSELPQVAELLKKALIGPDFGSEPMRGARQRLQKLEAQFPDNKVLEPIRQSLHEQAQSFYDDARRLGKNKDTLPQALKLLDLAEEAWPGLPNLSSYRVEINPGLRVGVRQLPKFLSPGLATTDTELRAVELLFEGLVKACPDEQGVVRYRPALAEGRPRIVPLGREFLLPRTAVWSNGEKLTASDVRASVQLVGRGAWAEVLDDNVSVRDPYQVLLPLKHGFLEPLALMTFKIVPAKEDATTQHFAEHPVSSGPFVYQEGTNAEAGRPFVAFRANPQYTNRPSKFGMPKIQEVRFYTTVDPVKDLETGQLDVVLDLTAEQAADLRLKTRTATVMLPSSTSVNRRVYFLAVNQKRIRSTDLRRAVALAINREKLLKDFFRGPFKDIDPALNGPFPARSWVCRPAQPQLAPRSLDPYDPGLAKGKAQTEEAKEALPQAGNALTLKYPIEDPALAKALAEGQPPPKPTSPLTSNGDLVLANAMIALAEQVKEATGIVLKLEACDPRELRKSVEQDRGYDLAYYHYDFPDETYCLWPLLREGNYLGFSNPLVETALREAMVRRDFTKVQQYTRQIHEVLAGEMPLIPLWQLDPLHAWARYVTPGAVDPILVFNDIEHWELAK
jgi:ABC-type transport system substrate-binding protein